ncbi:MAG: argininosuccinate lyase [Methanoregulaceae archaeon]
MRKDVVRQGRLTGDRSSDIAVFLSSMQADRFIADADILVDIAHVVMLERQHILETECAGKLLAALLAIHEKGVPEEAFDEHFEDIHAGIESLVIAETGAEIGGRMHMGRSRNDEVATCIRIRIRSGLLEQMYSLLRIRKVLLTLASRHTGTVMPGFTHFQHAQPTTLAHHLLAYEQAFSRDAARLSEAYARVNQSPLGAAAFASTGYPIDRNLTADLLGFNGLVLNTMDAVATRDFAMEVLGDLSILMATVSRLCEEMVIWSSSFVRFVDLGDAFCSTSSIMPQKKNPDTAEIMRAKAASVFSGYAGAFVTVKGLPMSYNRDLQELTPNVWRGLQDAAISLRILGDLLESAKFDTARMAEEAGKGFSTATELADTLVRNHGLPFRTAHNIVGRAVQKGTLSLAMLDIAANEIMGETLSSRGFTENEIAFALDVTNSVALRKAPGGPAPDAIKSAISEQKTLLAHDTALLEERTRKIADSERKLMETARRMVA